jgi:DNA-binding beta-propeller fold protein YncE
LKRVLALAAVAACVVGCPSGTNPTSPGAQSTTTSIGGRPLEVAAAGGNVYVAGGSAGALDVYGIDAGKVINHLPLAGGTPGVLRLFLDRRQIAVQDTDNGLLEVIDAGTAVNRPGDVHLTPPPVAMQLLQTLPVGKGAGRLAFGENNTTVLSSAGNDDKVVLFTFADDRAKPPVRTEFTIGAADPTGQARPIDFKGGKILTFDFSKSALVSIQTGTTAVKTLATLGAVGPLSFGLVNGVPTTALAADSAHDSLVMVDLATGTPTTLTGLGKGIRAMAVDPDAGRVYLAMHDSDEIAVVDYVAKTLVARLPVGSHPTSVSLAPPVPRELWVSGEGGTLTVVDDKGEKPVVKATLPLGQGDHRMTFWSTKGFLSNQNDGTLSIVNRETLF